MAMYDPGEGKKQAMESCARLTGWSAKRRRK